MVIVSDYTDGGNDRSGVDGGSSVGSDNAGYGLDKGDGPSDGDNGGDNVGNVGCRQ
jgi:hypothetical protein